MACHLHEEINFRSNMTQDDDQSCVKNLEKMCGSSHIAGENQMKWRLVEHKRIAERTTEVLSARKIVVSDYLLAAAAIWSAKDVMKTSAFSGPLSTFQIEPA
jgi:hypothetical protein